MSDAAPIGHNASPFIDAADLLDKFARAPQELDVDTAGLAVTLAKQMKLEQYDVDTARKNAEAPLREELAAVAAPYKSVVQRLDDARKSLLSRLHDYMTKHGLDRVQSDYGPKAYQKTVVTFTIDDIRDVPRDFLIPDMARIAKAVDADIDIPGVRRIVTKQTIVS